MQNRCGREPLQTVGRRFRRPREAGGRARKVREKPFLHPFFGSRDYTVCPPNLFQTAVLPTTQWEGATTQWEGAKQHDIGTVLRACQISISVHCSLLGAPPTWCTLTARDMLLSAGGAIVAIDRFFSPQIGQITDSHFRFPVHDLDLPGGADRYLVGMIYRLV